MLRCLKLQLVPHCGNDPHASGYPLKPTLTFEMIRRHTPSDHLTDTLRYPSVPRHDVVVQTSICGASYSSMGLGPNPTRLFSPESLLCPSVSLHCLLSTPLNNDPELLAPVGVRVLLAGGKRKDCGVV